MCTALSSLCFHMIHCEPSAPIYRLLVEKIFAQYMVPHSLDTEEKMKCLYYLYACLDTNAVKSVNLQYQHHMNEFLFGD